MQIKRPSHTTVVAYLALFAALGGTAIAARNDTGAKELKKPVIRERSTTVDPSTGISGNTRVVVSCKRHEQLLGGTAGWKGDAGEAGQTAVVSTELDKGDVTAIGTALNESNTLRAQAVCLPR